MSFDISASFPKAEIQSNSPSVTCSDFTRLSYKELMILYASCYVFSKCLSNIVLLVGYFPISILEAYPILKPLIWNFFVCQQGSLWWQHPSIFFCSVVVSVTSSCFLAPCLLDPILCILLVADDNLPAISLSFLYVLKHFFHLRPAINNLSHDKSLCLNY